VTGLPSASAVDECLSPGRLQKAVGRFEVLLCFEPSRTADGSLSGGGKPTPPE
jgi:hypothetical protein